MSKVSVNLTMFEGKTRECISRAVQQRMFGWGYKWSKWYTVYPDYRFTKKGYLYMNTDGTITYSPDEIPHDIRSCKYMEYTAEEFLSLTADPLKATAFEVGKPYTNYERVVICTESVDEHRFKGVSIYNILPWKQGELWKEELHSKAPFTQIDPSRIQIEVLPCK